MQRVAAVDQHADVADPGLPPVADQQRAVGVHLVGLLVVDAARERGHRQAVEIERAAGDHVDLAGEPGLDLVGGARLEHVDALDEVRRHVLERKGLAGGGEDVAPVERGQRVGEAADLDSRRLALAAIGDLNAGDSLERLHHVIVRQLADVLGHDRVDDLGRFAAPVERADDGGADAGDDHIVGRLILRGRVNRVGGVAGGGAAGGVAGLFGGGPGNSGLLRTGLREGARRGEQR